MDVSLAGIAPDILRTSVYPPWAPASLGCFLIGDD
jgi:hypothetical protein